MLMSDLLSKKYPKCKHPNKTPITEGGAICKGWSKCDDCGSIVRSDLTFDQWFSRFMLAATVVLFMGIASLNYMI
jgi:hypothetical protein